MSDAKTVLVTKAKELAALATSRGVRLPAGADGLGRAANALNTTKNGAEFDLVRAVPSCVGDLGTVRAYPALPLSQDAALKALAKQFGGGDAQLQEQAAGPAAPDLEAQVNPKKRKADEKKEAAKAAKKAELEALPNRNPELVAIFEELADLVLKYGGDKSHFGAAAYRKVALRLREVDAVIKSGKEAGKLENVGKKSADIVEAYLQNKTVPILEEFRAIDRGELAPHPRGEKNEG